MGHRRGPATTPEAEAKAKRNGRTYIPTRQEMNEKNRPLRDAAEAKRNPTRKKR